MIYVAGHQFDSLDRCVLEKTVDGYTFICGCRWNDIKDADESCIGPSGPRGYAHVSYLTPAEYTEIVRERERRENLYVQATKGVSGGGEYAEPAPGALPEPQSDTMMCWVPRRDMRVRPGHLVTVNVTLRPEPPEPLLSVDDFKRGMLAHFRDIYGEEPDEFMLALIDSSARAALANLEAMRYFCESAEVAPKSQLGYRYDFELILP